jgi:formylglycine-generating enzyme required for sulfatase activity
LREPTVVELPPAPIENAWVRITVPAKPVILGIESDDVPVSIRGFRPARKVVSPATPYELQEHEVTWSEIEPWLGKTHTSLPLPSWATDPNMRRSLPVTGASWFIASEYCASLLASLPTEEQWEYAARGADRRPNSWGIDRLDRSLMRAYLGTNAIPAAVKSSVQDRTPEPRLYDLIGNVQEWTLGLWRPDAPGDASWAAIGKETSIRAIRGFPLADEPPDSIQPEGAAYREPLCATGPCVKRQETIEVLRRVGFRCARSGP